MRCHDPSSGWGVFCVSHARERFCESIGNEEDINDNGGGIPHTCGINTNTCLSRILSPYDKAFFVVMLSFSNIIFLHVCLKSL